jgi:hypothetical protein
VTADRDKSRDPATSFVETLARATGILGPSTIIAPPGDDTALADYKVQVAGMLREKADHWQRRAATQSDSDEIATCLAYVGAYSDAANLIEFGEVAW